MSLARHGDDLEVLMKKLIILSEVASLSMLPHMPSRRLELEELSDEASRERIDEPLDKGIITNEESSTLEIFNLLEEWNEPFKFKPCKRVSS